MNPYYWRGPVMHARQARLRRTLPAAAPPMSSFQGGVANSSILRNWGRGVLSGTVPCCAISQSGLRDARSAERFHKTGIYSECYFWERCQTLDQRPTREHAQARSDFRYCSENRTIWEVRISVRVAPARGALHINHQAATKPRDLGSCTHRARAVQRPAFTLFPQRACVHTHERTLRNMVAANKAKKQQPVVVETEPKIETTAVDDQTQSTADFPHVNLSSRQSHGGEESHGAPLGIRSGGEGKNPDPVPAIGQDELDEEAAVGSIHHILKTAFKELYGGGSDNDETEDGAAEEGNGRQGTPANASDSGSRRSSAVAMESAANGGGEEAV